MEKPLRLPVEHLLGQRMKAPIMKSVNGIELLNLIREHGPVSRAGLAKLSRLSKPTVSSLVEDLIRRSLVVEEGPGTSGARGGKIPTLVNFNAACGLLVAVDIGSDCIRAAVTDLEGNIVDRAATPTCVELGAEGVLERTHKLVWGLVGGVRGRRSKLRGIAVSTSGRVDVGQGLVLETGNVFNWRNVPVRERMERAFRSPVSVDNDVNMAALAEMHHGAARGLENFVLVRLETGIGCGIVLGGRIYHGANWAAGEIAHAVLAESALAADWGPRGYLENMVGEDVVVERLVAAGIEGPDPIAALEEAAGKGDARACELLDRVAHHLGAAAALVAAAYDPSLIVLQGRFWRSLFPRVTEIVHRVIPWKVEVALSTAGDEAVLLGTVIAARVHAYERIARGLNEKASA